MGQTIVEKIAQTHLAEGPKRPLRTGDFVAIRPHRVMTHDNTSAVMKKFQTIGAKKIQNPKQLVFALDHDIQNKEDSNLHKYQAIEGFAKYHGVDFYPAGSGIGHQIMVERGYVVPGSFVVASDSHSNMYGALGAVGTPIVRTDAAAAWATGDFWWQIPRSVQVVLEGTLPAGTTGKDVIITLCGLYNHDEVLNAAVEFSGPGVASLSMDARFSISNMSTEWGPLVGWFPVDVITLKYLAGVQERLAAQGIERFSDEDLLKWTTKPPQPVLQGKKVAEGVEMYLGAASKWVQDEAERRGIWKTLLDAGAHPLPAGCGPCIGLGVGLLEPGEVGISATNRNFKGRMGSRDAKCYLASPEVVAASALAGYIRGPYKMTDRTPARTYQEFPVSAAPEKVEILPGFPERARGRLVFLPADNVNTDSIYGKDYTYRDDVTLETMARVVMENYDPQFSARTHPGDVIVSGFNFGTGSSREQAVTCLKAKGIPLVIAASFSQTYLRNAYNNGFLCIEVPELVKGLRGQFVTEIAAKEKTIIPGGEIDIDFTSGVIVWAGEMFAFPPLGSVPQSLVIAQGVENLVAKRLGLG